MTATDRLLTVLSVLFAAALLAYVTVGYVGGMP